MLEFIFKRVYFFLCPRYFGIYCIFNNAINRKFFNIFSLLFPFFIKKNFTVKLLFKSMLLKNCFSKVYSYFTYESFFHQNLIKKDMNIACLQIFQLQHTKISRINFVGIYTYLGCFFYFFGIIYSSKRKGISYN